MLLNESRPHDNNVSCFIQKHSAAKLLPTRHAINVLPKLKLLNASYGFLVKSFIPTTSIYMEPVQGLNLNRQYISGLEPEVPVTSAIQNIEIFK